MLIQPLDSYFVDEPDEDDPIEEEPILPTIDLDLTDREWLTPVEIAFLACGIKDTLDRYRVKVRAHRGVCSQIRLLLRCVGRMELHYRGMSDYNPKLRSVPDLIDLVEVPIP